MSEHEETWQFWLEPALTHSQKKKKKKKKDKKGKGKGIKKAYKDKGKF